MRTPNTNCVICNKSLYRRTSEFKKSRYFACKICREFAKKKFFGTSKQLNALKLGRTKGDNHLAGIPKSKHQKQIMSIKMLNWCKNNKTKVVERGKKSRGKNHYNWKGGISKLNLSIRLMVEYRKWQQKIKHRDKKCIYCNSILELESHHIIPFSMIIEKHNIKSRDEARLCKELWNIKNGITLCKRCHYKLHGRKYVS